MMLVNDLYFDKVSFVSLYFTITAHIFLSEVELMKTAYVNFYDVDVI